MAYVNLPPNLQDLFGGLGDRIAKLESGPNAGATDAAAAMSAADAAEVAAAAAIADAGAAYTLAGTKNKVFYAGTAPTATAIDDQWINTAAGNKLYIWNGTAWISVQDTAISTAQSAATAAQTTADGKNKIYRQGTSPGTTGNAIGDIWFNTASDNAISRWDGTSWVSTALGNNALVSIGASKITAGTIDASVITVSNLNAGNISTGTLAAARIATGSLDASKITAGTITASQIATGTITATQIAGGTITATQISSSYVYAGTIAAGNISAGTLSASVALTATSGTIGSFNISSTYLGNLAGYYWNASSGAFSTNNIYIQASSGATGISMQNGANIGMGGGNINCGAGNVTSTGTGQFGVATITTSLGCAASAFSGAMTYAGIATGSGTPMVCVVSGSRVAQTTSSERFKQDINYISSTGWLDKVLAMKPITYKTSEDFTTAGEPNETQIGFLAEDIYDIGGGLETAVILDPLGDPFSLSYDRFTIFLMLAIKELKTEIDELKGK